MKKGQIDISFTIIFAIIAGAFILGLAIYGIVRLTGTEQEVQDAKTGKEIGVLLNPLETGYETGKVTSFSLPVETRIYSDCKEGDIFGKQLIRLSQKNFNKWSDTDVDISFENKYIFAERPIEGKNFHVFSKPFEFPFKTADLMYITSSKDKYCFSDAPTDIKNELESLGQENIFVADCPEESTFVCFDGQTGCDIVVSYEEGYVEKGSNRVYFEGDALMYAGIFSDPDIYECQLKRLIKKSGILAQLYVGKANFVSQKGCNSNLNSELLMMINSGNALEDSSELKVIAEIAEELNEKNKFAECRLW